MTADAPDDVDPIEPGFGPVPAPRGEARGIPFFGEPWPSGICDDGHRVATPLGARCALCGEQIAQDDRGSFMGDGSPVHRECSLRSVLGGYGHFTDHAYWCVRRHDPDGDLSYRESALRVWEMVTLGVRGPGPS
jgi:hypothetical protein